jgi:hypothetical protein
MLGPPRRPAVLVALLAVLAVPRLVAAQAGGPQTGAAQPGAAQPGAADRGGVEQAVADYVDALYEVDSARVTRSVHPSLSKVGFERSAGGYRASRMTYDELRALAARWNARRRFDVAKAPREIVVLDLLDQTASAKLVAHWGVDYLHLAKYGGRWQIVNVLWQSPPARTAAAATGAP